MPETKLTNANHISITLIQRNLYISSFDESNYTSKWQFYTAMVIYCDNFRTENVVITYLIQKVC